jgi:hypothetical protein
MALKALQADKMSPLVQRCQKASNDSSTRHTVGLYWVPGHAGIRGNEIADKLATGGFTQIGPEMSLIVSRQNSNNNIKYWVDNKHLAMWHGPCSYQRQTQKLISGSSLATRAWLLSFTRTRSRVITGLLTRHNTLRRHLYLTEFINLLAPEFFKFF